MADKIRDESDNVRNAILTTVDNQKVKGILNSFDDNSGKIALRNVSIDNIKLPGLHYFYASNIKDLELTEGGKESSETEGVQKVGKQLPHKKELSKGGRDVDCLVESFGHLGDDSGDQGFGSSSEEADNYEDYYGMGNYIMFCRTCDKFRDSITYLMRQDVIAVTFHGRDISRNGILSLIEVATEDDIIIYDVLRLGLEGFVDGLQAVLESQNVVKVIHDCRMVSDALFHQYNVTLSNVFDTQVGGVFAFRLSSGGDWPRFVDSLPVTLMTQLGLKDGEVHHFFTLDTSKQTDDIWLQRPVCDRLLKNSLKNLVHMIPLYRTLLAKLMTEFQIGVQLYLDNVRNTPQDKVNKCMSFSHLLPYVFQDLPKYAADSAKTKPCYRAKSSLCLKDFKAKNNPLVHGNAEDLKHGKNPVLNRDGVSQRSDRQTWSAKQRCKLASNKKITADHSEESRHEISDPSPSGTSSSLLRLSPPKSLEPSAETKLNHSSLISSLGQSHISHHSSVKRSSAPSAAELFRRLLPSPKPETEDNAIQSDTSSVSEGYISSRSTLSKSALMKIAPSSCSSASSVSSESLSEPEIEYSGLDSRRSCSAYDGLDADKVLEMEMARNILQQARQTCSSKSDIKRHLLPAKLKHSPKKGS